MTFLQYSISLFLGPFLAGLIFLLIYRKRGRDRYQKLITSFIWGMFSIVVVTLFQYIAYNYGLHPEKNLRQNIFYSFMVIGIGSELGKYIVLRYIYFPKDTFKGPIDGIVYSVFISMGFATIANILYFTLPFFKEISFSYSITMVISNLFIAVIMGFFVGIAKSRNNKFVDSLTGLFGAAFFHALYSFCSIAHDYKLLLFLSIGTFIIVILLYYKAFELNEERKRNG
ncbi:MAG: PrsW family intramembrane metalloprotease [Chlorobi bacterium]|nr:PrsW family intramembrane metalloprotease [Chlorobiota bacterium]